MDAQEFQKAYGALVARAWSDESFRDRLLKEPARVLAENGLEVPAGVEVRMVESTADVMYLTLPPKPSGELSEEQLSGVSGGGFNLLGSVVGISACCCCLCCCICE